MRQLSMTQNRNEPRTCCRTILELKRDVTPAERTHFALEIKGEFFGSALCVGPVGVPSSLIVHDDVVIAVFAVLLVLANTSKS